MSPLPKEAAPVKVSPVIDARVVAPMSLVRALAIEFMLILSFAVALAPTWKFWAVNVPSSTFTPLNEVFCATRSISAESCCTSASIVARSPALLVALADCTASSRIRCRLSEMALSEPSAVCAREMPSLA
ncbi:MAG: hypothetical protein WC830_08125, partial [Burkholderiales bacterium]